MRAWADENHLLLDGHEFQRRWREQGECGGHENDVYFDEASQRWFKRNNLSMHGSWLEFLQRLMLHNYLFPETAVTFEGLIVNELKLSAELQELSKRSTTLRGMMAARGAGLAAVFAQPSVLIARRYVSHEELVHHMTKLGHEFVPRSNETFINREAGIVVRDLHDANVVFNAHGEIVIIDPVPVLDSASKLDRLQRQSAEHNDAWIN